MITIETHKNYPSESAYILSVIFREFLGLNINIKFSERKDVSITMNDNRELVIANSLLTTPPEKWLTPASLPKQPLKTWNLATTLLNVITQRSTIPVIYGDDPHQNDFFSYSDSKIYLGLDIFGSAFFMLTRYEEVVKPERDQHDRFPAVASLAYQEGFLDRPIVNEYLEILWACLKLLWNGLQRKPREFQICLSHDVDEPFKYVFSGIPRLISRCGGDIILRRNPTQVFSTISDWIKVKMGNLDADPCNTFDLIMDLSESQNIRSAFYFITAHSGGDISRYNFEHPLIRNLLQKIYTRGHEIGLHPSYNTYKDPRQIKREFSILTRVCEEENIKQNYWGGRQHFLRWETPITFQNWEDAGLDYDSTLGFADLPGFRCGVCYEFPVFNLKTRQSLKLRERPLIVMECTIIYRNGYMSLGTDDNPKKSQSILEYKRTCQIYKGQFNLLWHNSSLLGSGEVALYKNVII